MGLDIIRRTHLNHVVPNLRAALHVYAHVLHAEPFHHGSVPEQGQIHSLIRVANLNIELFGVTAHPNSLDGFLSKFGGGWHSLQWQVPSLDEAAQVLRASDVRIPVYVPHRFLFTHPLDGYGMMFELRESSLDPENLVCAPPIDRELRNANPGRPSRQVAFWSTNGLRISGLHSIEFAPSNLHEAARFLTEVLNGQVLQPVSSGGRHSLRVHVADTTIQLVGSAGSLEHRARPTLRLPRFSVTDINVSLDYLRETGYAHIWDPASETVLVNDARLVGGCFELTGELPFDSVEECL